MTTQPAEQHLPVAAGDGPAVSSDAVPGSFSEADGGGASDREAAAAAAEAALLKRETGVSNILLNSLSLCSPSTAPPRPAGQLSSQTDWSHTAATDEASVHSAQPPSLFANVLPQPDGQPTIQRGSSSAVPDQAAPGRAVRSGQGQRTEAAGARQASRRELFRQKVAAAQAGARRQPEPGAAEAGRPDTSQPTLRQAEPSQWEPSQGEVRQAEPGQAELSRCKPTSASPVTAAGSAQLSSTIAAAGDGLGSTPVAALAVAAGSPGCAASPQATCMGSPGGAEPAMPQGRSSSTDSRPEEGVTSGTGLPQEGAEGGGRIVHWSKNTAVQEAADPDEELTFSIRRMSAVKRAEQDAQQVPASESAAPEDAGSSASSSAASSEAEEALISADGTHPAEEAEGTAAEEVHWAENTALEEGAVPEEDLMYAIRRMSAAVREQTSPVHASSETAMPAGSALSSPMSAHQAARCSNARRSGSTDTIEPVVQANSTPAPDLPSPQASGALECTMSALHLVASTDTASQLSRAGAGQAAQAAQSPATTGFEHLLERFVGSPAEMHQSACPASSPLAPIIASEPLGECLTHMCAVSGKDILALRALYPVCRQTLRGSASVLIALYCARCQFLSPMPGRRQESAAYLSE